MARNKKYKTWIVKTECQPSLNTRFDYNSVLITSRSTRRAGEAQQHYSKKLKCQKSGISVQVYQPVRSAGFSTQASNFALCAVNSSSVRIPLSLSSASLEISSAVDVPAASLI